jgi:hypothetical protein
MSLIKRFNKFKRRISSFVFPRYQSIWGTSCFVPKTERRPYFSNLEQTFSLSEPLVFTESKLPAFFQSNTYIHTLTAKSEFFAIYTGTTRCRCGSLFNVGSRFARCHIFKPKIPIWVNVWRVLLWKMWYILRPFGLGILQPIVIFCGHLVYFMVICYIFSRFGK